MYVVPVCFCRFVLVDYQFISWEGGTSQWAFHNLYLCFYCAMLPNKKKNWFHFGCSVGAWTYRLPVCHSSREFLRGVMHSLS